PNDNACKQTWNQYQVDIPRQRVVATYSVDTCVVTHRHLDRDIGERNCAATRLSRCRRARSSHLPIAVHYKVEGGGIGGIADKRTVVDAIDQFRQQSEYLRT